jgi:hypothetical protein
MYERMPEPGIGPGAVIRRAKMTPLGGGSASNFDPGAGERSAIQASFRPFGSERAVAALASLVTGRRPANQP